MNTQLEVFLDDLEVITDEPGSDSGPPPEAEPITDALSKADRDALPASDFAVPGKRALPMHDKKHAKLAWTQVAKTKDLTDQERRTAYRRILRRLKKLGVDVTGYKVPTGAKAMTDAAEPPVSVSWPEELSLDDLRTCLRAELKEAYPKYYLIDVYPGLGLVTASRSSYYDDKGEWCYDNHTYTISYEITEQDDGDGDVDMVNIKFGEPKVSIMTPKVIEDDVQVVQTGQAEILTDEEELKRGAPFRFRLPGPRADVVNNNNRLYPRQVLLDAIQTAKPRMQRGEMFSYMGHPPRVQTADGRVVFKPEMEKRVAKIINWFMDEHGQTFVDREIIPTPAGQIVRANIEANAAVATSLRALGETVKNVFSGRTVNIARSLFIDGDDFVENPALTSTWARAQMLTDSQVSALIDSAAVPAELSNPNDSVPPPAPAGTEAAKATAASATANSPTLPDGQPQVTTPTTEAIEDSMEPKEGQNNPNPPAPPAPAAQAEQGSQTTTNPTAQPAPAPEPAQQQQAATATTSILDGIDGEELKTIITNHRAQTQKENVKAFLDDVFGGKETVSPRDKSTKVAVMDFSRFTNEDITDIRAMCDEASADEVESVLSRAVAWKDKEIARRKLNDKGYRSSAAGETVGHAVITDEHLPGKEHVEKLLKAMDDYGLTTSGNFRPNSALRKANQAFIDSVIDGVVRRFNQGKALLDSSEHFLDAETTTEQLLNQATITPATVALITQIFWGISWLPMCGGIGPSGFNAGPGSDAGIGLNLRIPVETRPSGARDLRVGENMPIPTVGTLLRWLNFMPEWRKLAFSLTPEAKTELERGPGRYDALARDMFAVTQIFNESIDLELAHEHLNASDEFQAVPVVAEAHVDGDLITAAQDLRDLGYVPVADGGNIATAIKITQKVPNHNTVQRPIVPERLTRVLQEDGSVNDQLNTLLNPVKAQIGANPVLIRGELGAIDDVGTIGIIDRPNVPGAQYAVDYENGIYLFKAVADSGVQAGSVPALTYSYVTNFDVFDLNGSATADDLAIFYDSLLRRIDATAADMGEQPRFRPPNFAIFTLRNAVFAESARQAAQLFKPSGTDVAVTAANPNSFGSRSGVGFMKVNTPWRCGGQRILLGQERATKYGIQLPWKVEGPVHRYAIVGGVPVPTGTNFYYGMQNSVICTPVCFNKKQDGSILQLNHPYRTIKLIGTGKV